MDKVNRSYELFIQNQDGSVITVLPPFSVEFDIQRNNLSGANTGSVRIFNLAPQTRNQILKNVFDFGNVKTITFNAGYMGFKNENKNFPTVLNGLITEAFSVREGVNFITQIEVFDGGYAFNNSKINTQFPGATPARDVLKTMVKSLSNYGVISGAIGEYEKEDKDTRGNSYSGNTTNHLAELTNGGFFIDNGVAHCLGVDECLDGDIPLISPQTGLIGTPVRENTLIRLETLFEPSLVIGQLAELKSVTEPIFNGKYKITALHHRGIISPVISGDAMTSITMLAGVFTGVPVEVL